MNKTLPTRRELRFRIKGGEPHYRLMQELAGLVDKRTALRLLATLPVRWPVWWEKVVGAWVLLFWSLYVVFSTSYTFIDSPDSIEYSLGAWLLSCALAIQVWRRNGAVYAVGALWLGISLFLDWVSYEDDLELGNDPGIAHDDMVFVTWVFLLTIASMLALWVRLFNHVTFFGKHRDSDERRIVQF